MIKANELREKKCKACEGGVGALSEVEIKRHLACLSGWDLQSGEIVKLFNFKNYYETTSFVNAVIWIAHHEDHHPQIEFGYKSCKIRYSTHSVKGISENDFICAAKIDGLLQ